MDGAAWVAGFIEEEDGAKTGTELVAGTGSGSFFTTVCIDGIASPGVGTTGSGAGGFGIAGINGVGLELFVGFDVESIFFYYPLFSTSRYIIIKLMVIFIKKLFALATPYASSAAPAAGKTSSASTREAGASGAIRRR